MDKAFFDKIRKLIEQAKTKKALQELKAACERENLVEHLDPCSQLLSRIGELENKNMMGIISNNDYATERNTIAYQTLSLIRKIEYTDEIPDASEIQIKPAEKAQLEINISKKLKSIAWLEKGLDCSKSVCLITSHAGTGTGFLFQENYVMTNNHVIPEKKFLDSCILQFNHQQGKDGAMLIPENYIPDGNYFTTNKELDYTIFSVSPKSENGISLGNWGKLRLASSISMRQVSKNQHVTIIQHPEGGPKQIALNENRITKTDTIKVFYETDTEGGSSGSPVFNDKWEVVALHHGGYIKEKNPKTNKNTYHNGGINIQRIQEDLAARKFNLVSTQ